jgi:hypothetical protein
MDYLNSQIPDLLLGFGSRRIFLIQEEAQADKNSNKQNVKSGVAMLTI